MIFKLIQIMVACAIFNPFCCCTAGVLTANESGDTTTAHNCCQSQTLDTSDTAPASNDHNPDDCPHKALKEYQSSALKDVAALHYTVNSQPQLYAIIDTVVFETAEGQTSELSSGFESQSIDARLTAAKKKSGPLFALALELPLIVAGNQESLADAHEAACLFGLGYQILDDLKDQRSDAEKEINGNVVLAMMSDSPDISAETRAIELAQRLLHKAILNAEDLPQGVGTPLIDLVKDLLLQIDFFASAT